MNEEHPVSDTINAFIIEVLNDPETKKSPEVVKAIAELFRVNYPIA
jgi:hypothetical protein